MKNHILIKREYYTKTAELFDSWQIAEGDEHDIALNYISMLCKGLQVRSILDVGAGTGRAVEYLLREGFDVQGIEPVQAMIDVAADKGIPRQRIIQGGGESLPFPDDSFEAVCETGMLHHVKKPEVVVSEMMRVSRKMIFLSDENRFGRGTLFRRVCAFLLYKSGLFRHAYLLKTRGKGYRLSETDGLSYSYSVYDSFSDLTRWADTVFLVPLDGKKPQSWFHPLFTSSQVLLCAIKNH